MSIVLVFGAGASYGDLLQTPSQQRSDDANPPLTRGFFRGDLYHRIDSCGNQVEQHFTKAFQYIRGAFAIPAEPVGEGRWASLNVEDIFTSVELDREFHSPESDTGGRLTVTRNQLVRYLWFVIARCTQYKHGQYYQRVASFVESRNDVSVLTFNWDLLLDQEFTAQQGSDWVVKPGAYQNFMSVVLGEEGVRSGSPLEAPMFLKMHGSLNWFQCANAQCPDSYKIEIKADMQDCLYRARGLELAGAVTCSRCGTEMETFLVPPLVKKPVTENRIIRAVWGHARQRLSAASKVVIVGFSAAPTDFYAQWLFRSTLGTRPREEVEIIVVNPENDRKQPPHFDFENRMRNMFPLGYVCDFTEFSQIDSVLERIRKI